MSNTSNPYAAPPDVVDVGPATPNAPFEDRFAQTYQVIITWEKLRIVYNAVLVVVTLGVAWLTWEYRPTPLMMIGTVGLGAIAANILFCAGHAVDGFLTLCGIRQPAVTWALFGFGTLLASGLAALTVIGTFSPPW
ncbi:MAG: hypothetical protein JW818_08255 [Pirellulales bacterium]|nr:hypothetical protein [Pirellulales bacterium]